MADVGSLALILALFLGTYAIIALLAGQRFAHERVLASGRGAVLAVCFLATVASGILVYFLVTSNFTLQYVVDYTSTDLPFFYKFAAFWAGNAGSILLWVLVLSTYAAYLAIAPVYRAEAGLPYVLAILMGNTVFYLYLLNFVASPFQLAAQKYIEGNGLNPLLQNPGMVFHPITLYLGYIGFAVPFAYAMMALITKRAGDRWIKVTRRWTVTAWLFLTLGNLYGGQWSYVELGWGGFYMWDPVENASLMPWFTGTAFLHSVMIQERKDMLKVWNMALIIITYVLTVLGTFMVRTGILTSVHAFSNSSMGAYFLGYIGITLAWSLYLLVDRSYLLAETRELESYVSRESSFLLNNLLLVGAAFATLWGTLFPLVSEAVRNVKVAVSMPFYNQVVGPILLAMLFVMGVCPLIAWQKSSLKNLRRNLLWPLVSGLVFGLAIYPLLPARKPFAALAFGVASFVAVSILQECVRGIGVRHRVTGESYPLAFLRMVMRNRRRYGGYIIHLGIVLMAVAIVAYNAFRLETTKTVNAGEQIQIGSYILTFNGLFERPEGKNTVVYANLAVSRDGQPVGTIRPEKIFYASWNQPSTEVAIRGTFKEDLYVALSTWENNGRTATFKVLVNPLVQWLWIGGYVLVLGSLLALWPGRSENAPKYTRYAEAGALQTAASVEA